MFEVQGDPLSLSEINRLVAGSILSDVGYNISIVRDCKYALAVPGCLANLGD